VTHVSRWYAGSSQSPPWASAAAPDGYASAGTHACGI